MPSLNQERYFQHPNAGYQEALREAAIDEERGEGGPDLSEAQAGWLSIGCHRTSYERTRHWVGTKYEGVHRQIKERYFRLRKEYKKKYGFSDTERKYNELSRR